jgi:hypothetical protein
MPLSTTTVLAWSFLTSDRMRFLTFLVQVALSGTAMLLEIALQEYGEESATLAAGRASLTVPSPLIVLVLRVGILFALGWLVCYQFFSAIVKENADALNHLETMGWFSIRRHLGLVLRQGLMVGSLGFFAAVAIARTLLWVIGMLGQIQPGLTLLHLGYALSISLIMGVTSALASFRKVMSRNPSGF